MPLIMFAKHTAGMDIPETVAKAKAWGLDGLDYPIRKGYAVNPENFAARLPELVRTLRAQVKDVDARELRRHRRQRKAERTVAWLVALWKMGCTI